MSPSVCVSMNLPTRLFFKVLFLAFAIVCGTFGEALAEKPVKTIITHKARQAPVPVKESARAESAPTEFHRIDPHGSAKTTLKLDAVMSDKACEVCHAGGEPHPTVAFAAETCINCHNRQPHAGVVEHSKKDLNCTSCHSYHRADAISWQAPSGRFRSLQVKALAPGEIYKPSQHPMLKKTCMDCHKW